MGGEQRVLTALPLLEEVISDQRRQNSKENQDLHRITAVAVLKINESGRIRELCRAFCEIHETEKERMRTKGKKWKSMESNGEFPKRILRIKFAN